MLVEDRDKAVTISGRIVRIGRLDAELYHFLTDPEQLLARLRQSSERIDIFTFIQSVYETEPKYSYRMEWDNQAVLPITTFENWWSKQILHTARNRSQQAEKKGVAIREVFFDEHLAQGISEIYNEVPVRQGRPFRHYGQDLATVCREVGTYLDYSIFLGAYLGEELIGFIKLVSDESGVQTHLMQILSKIKYRDKCPTNALIAHAVRLCAERKIQYLVYGQMVYGKKPADSLSNFKLRNGFEKIDVPRYYIPITPWGKAAMRLGLHHKLSDRLPVSLMNRLRELRTQLYRRADKMESSS
jgi:hypothetical protein